MNSSDFAALKHLLSMGKWWDSGTIDDRYGIYHDFEKLRSNPGGPPFQAALSARGTVDVSFAAPVPFVPPRPDKKGIVGQVIIRDFHSLALVPLVPSENYWPMLLCMVRTLFAAISSFSVDVPPQLDDLSARCINRLGGWIGIRNKFTPQRYAELTCEFIRLAVELIPYKESGFYMVDRLPVLYGKKRTTIAYRLSWPPQLLDVRLRSA